MPPMTKSDFMKMNLQVINQIDPSISTIVDHANEVALYKYLEKSSAWEKTEVEGCLFVYQRVEKPHYGFMILNRLSKANVFEPITGNMEFQDQAPFLLYRNSKDDVYGIWFYEKKSCSKIFKLLMSFSKQARSKSEKLSSSRQRSFSESNPKQKAENSQTDIISLLSKAQDEYDKKSAIKGSPNPKQGKQPSTGDIVKPTPMKHINGAIISHSEATPLTIGMLFAQASSSIKPLEPQAPEVRARSFTAGNLNSSESILQNLLSNSARTLQHIDGAQKGLSRMLSVEFLEKDLKEKLNIHPSGDAKEKSGFRSSVEVREVSDVEETKVAAKSDPIDIPMLTPAMLDSTLSLGSLGAFMKSDHVRENGSLPNNQLLCPSDFTIPPGKVKKFPSSASPEIGSSFMNGNKSFSELLTPESLLNGSSAPTVSAAKSNVTPLSKEQLRETLIYMLERDDDFVIRLHQCYVNRLQNQFSLHH